MRGNNLGHVKGNHPDLNAARNLQIQRMLDFLKIQYPIFPLFEDNGPVIRQLFRLKMSKI